jgi:pimeloyl-ACP methyl ester carboxylesterase
MTNIRVFGPLIAVFAGVAATSCVAPRASERAAPVASLPQTSAEWYADYLAHSRLVQLPNGRQLNIYCEGVGAPTVVLEAGLGGFAFDWRAIQGKVAAHTQVCAYDRAGMGRSPAGPHPRDTRAQVADLEALLPAAGLHGPFVLVGHSMGGYNVRLFASRHMRDVAGMVLVDPSVENQIPAMSAAAPAGVGQMAGALARATACADPHRTAAVAADCVKAAPTSFPANLAQTYETSQGLLQSQTFLSEAESFIDLDSDQIAAERRPLGDIPLIVLTRTQRSTNFPADQAEAEWTLWNQLHDQVASLSTRGVNRPVQDAGHYIQLDQPQAVVDAVAEVVNEVRVSR